MPLGTMYIGDTTATAVNGVVTELSNPQLATLFGAGNVKKATAHFGCTYNKRALSYAKNQSFTVDAPFAAFLTAINAPVV